MMRELLVCALKSRSITLLGVRARISVCVRVDGGVERLGADPEDANT